jgi:(p)ppGpp synthase/HD superfamily hydrolase
MSQDILQFARALDFAAKKHVHQRRKGELGEPYINHLADVTRLLAAATEGRDAVLVLSGLLHDTIEDTQTTFDELEAEFGREVADLVAEVSDDKTLDRTERKRLQIEKAPAKSDRAKMLKLADKTSNLHSISHSPPKGWGLERKREYFAWAYDVVAGCRGVNEYLEKEFDRTWQRGTELLDEGA